jgi:hypothetical protein
MLFPEAQRILQQLLAPLTLDEFLDKTLSGGFQRIDGAGAAERMALLGPDPRAVLIGALHFSHPGGHLYLHRGAERSLLYMVNTPRFRVRDVPGEVADDVRLSLARKLVEIGFLKPA